MFWERGMKTFADWLKYYNLDVELFLEALKYMRDFYTGLGLNIFKDTVSLASIAMKCFLRGTLNKRDAPGLCAPGEEAYERSGCWGGRAWSFVESTRQSKREPVCTNSKTRSCVEKFWVTTPTRCTQEQCWVICPVARRSSWIGRKRRETWKRFADFCSKTDGLGSPRWTSRFSESCGRRLKKCRRCFTTIRFQVRRCHST